LIGSIRLICFKTKQIEPIKQDVKKNGAYTESSSYHKRTPVGAAQLVLSR
jgi:hypothetical protein